MRIDIHLIKTVHKENPYQRFDPQEFYTDENVYDLKHQIQRYFKHDYTLNLLTNDTTINAPDVKIKSVVDYDLWGWWNKMLLFSKDFTGPELNIYIDLDTVIQRDISNIVHFANNNMLTLLYSYWKPIDWEQTAYKASGYKQEFKHSTLLNSSIMMWHGNQLQHITELFFDNLDKNLVHFRGNDEYLSSFHKDRINVLPRGWCYSYFFGAEQGSEFFNRDKDAWKKREKYKIRLLNGEGKRQNKMIETRVEFTHD